MHVSASKFHTAISTADGDVLTWGYKQVRSPASMTGPSVRRMLACLVPGLGATDSAGIAV